MKKIIKRGAANVVRTFNLANVSGAKVLLYHSISNQKSIDPLGLRVSVENFNEQLNYLLQEDYEISLLSDIVQKRKFHKNVIAITFDDGYLDNLEVAAPVLNKYKISATLFISTAYLNGDQPSINYWDKWDHLSADQLKSLIKSGFEIGSHSHLHHKLNDFSDEELEYQIRSSKEVLEDIVESLPSNASIGGDVEIFSYPYGFYNERVKNVVRNCGFKSACCNIIGMNDSNADLFELKRISILANDSLDEFKSKLNGDYNWLGYFQRRQYYKKI